ncbi:hypothetical protein IFM89_015146 [Coptis chinensis]|uniref:Vacuolar protein 14 C-terminal Fig4-binding domain-containing protein n=1 Tax=Coptis chinensis TaxID=261450 RepID=A0A835HV29_9MAGN|nr:hypothetical protein IFM89_015146 [Coptis chinensis]
MGLVTICTAAFMGTPSQNNLNLSESDSEDDMEQTNYDRTPSTPESSNAPKETREVSRFSSECGVLVRRDVRICYDTFPTATETYAASERNTINRSKQTTPTTCVGRTPTQIIRQQIAKEARTSQSIWFARPESYIRMHKRKAPCTRGLMRTCVRKLWSPMIITGDAVTRIARGAMSGYGSGSTKQRMKSMEPVLDQNYHLAEENSKLWKETQTNQMNFSMQLEEIRSTMLRQQEPSTTNSFGTSSNIPRSSNATSPLDIVATGCVKEAPPTSSIKGAWERARDAPQFRQLVVFLVHKFRVDHSLLEKRGALIIHRLGILLDLWRVYLELSTILEGEVDLDFSSIMVSVLLFTKVKIVDSSPKFTKDAISVDSPRVEEDINVKFLVQLDKLIRLLETPIFSYLRLQLVMLLLARRRIKSHGNSNASGENSSSSKLGLIESIDEENNVKSEDERTWASPPITNEVPDPILSASPVGSGKATPFKHLLESTPNRLVRKRTFKKMQKTKSREKLSHFFIELKKSAFYPVIEYDRHTLVRHALAEKFDEIENFFGFPQLLSVMPSLREVLPI